MNDDQEVLQLANHTRSLQVLLTSMLVGFAALRRLAQADLRMRQREASASRAPTSPKLPDVNVKRHS